MSAYVTLFISEKKARDVVLRHILSADISEIEKLLDSILKDRLYNCCIDDRGKDDYLI